jgi:MFS family permease
MEEFGALRGTLMIAATGLAIGSAVLSPLCGYLLDRFSSRFLVLVGATAFGLGLLGIPAAPTSLVVILIFVLVLPFGIVLAGTLMASSLVARSFVQRRGTALRISALGTSLGGLILPILMERSLAATPSHVRASAWMSCALRPLQSPSVVRGHTGGSKVPGGGDPNALAA